MKAIWILGLSLLLLSCGSTQKVSHRKSNTKTVYQPKKINSKNYHHNAPREIKKLLNTAEKYIGVPYKYAGNTPSGFDCSGLVCQVFIENDKKLPRRSADQALQGEAINTNEIKLGDLVFFATSGGRKVSHVGIVYQIAPSGEISFIHASTSRGVIISSLNEKYWNKAFLFARRIL